MVLDFKDPHKIEYSGDDGNISDEDVVVSLDAMGVGLPFDDLTDHDQFEDVIELFHSDSDDDDDYPEDFLNDEYLDEDEAGAPEGEIWDADDDDDDTPVEYLTDDDLDVDEDILVERCNNLNNPPDDLPSPDEDSEEDVF